MILLFLINSVVLLLFGCLYVVVWIGWVIVAYCVIIVGMLFRFRFDWFAWFRVCCLIDCALVVMVVIMLFSCVMLAFTVVGALVFNVGLRGFGFAVILFIVYD